ncbi:MAG TPA: glucuronate isomerase, partial [Pseudolysinimonas sp.]|nr:glucuronate isomerase [Pseudolysinimonas sp.]
MDAPRLDPDRLLPADPRTRAVARELYAAVADAPIISPHGHVDPALLRDDLPFPDPATLLVSSDHYVTRLLHAGGATLPELGIGPDAAEPREVWRRFCAGWPLFAGTASGGWLRDILARVFELDRDPSAGNADELFERMSARLAEPALRPRALFAAARIEVLATTDDPLDPLDVHAQLRDRSLVPGRVIPTFRPDAYLDPARPDWNDRVDRLTANDATGFDGYLDALRGRREHFVRHGAVSADHGVLQPATRELPHGEAAALFDRLRRGAGEPGDAARFAAAMLFESARMSVDDGLVMTVHAGVLRDHHVPTWQRFGPDTGHDIPVPVS